MTCIFCAIVAGQARSWRVYEDEHCVAFLDVNPITPGHTLVVPRRHAADLLAMPEDEAQLVMRATHRVVRLLDEQLSPGGLNLVQANRAPAWQTVFHLHVHVLPRYDGDGLGTPWRAAPAEPAELTSMQARLRAGG